MKEIFLVVTGLLMIVTHSYGFINIDLEAGAAISGYNDVRIPGKGDATKFSLSEELESDPVFSYRVNLSYRFRERHSFSLLYAPLKIEPSGKIARDITFQGLTFTAEEAMTAIYRFDSYRLQYRYFFHNQNRIIRAVGATIKLRDAEIALRSEDQSASKTNTGFVPLLSFLLVWDMTPKISLLADGEGLWSPFGRAADVFTGLSYRLDNRSSLKAGYRFLEGGSDGDEVYTFALINYIVLGFMIKL